MKIEIEENDFREINDKLGRIRRAALLARMSTDRQRVLHIKDILCWAQEITIYFNTSMLVEDGK